MSEETLQKHGFSGSEISVIKKLLKTETISLNPMQVDFLEKGFINEEKLIIATPTASGKTLCVFLKYLKNLQHDKKKLIYVVPYTRIRNEFIKEFKKFSALKITVTWDYKNYEDGKAQIFVGTYASIDHLLLAGKKLVSDFFVFDECDMVTDDLQGMSTESAISRIIRESEISSLFALSATIGKPELVEKWLSCKTFVHNYRPVKIEKQIKEYPSEKDQAEIIDIIFGSKENEQQPMIVFYYNTRHCRSNAVKLADFAKYDLKEKDDVIKEAVRNITDRCDPTGEITDQIKCISKGIAFYYSRLQPQCKDIIEQLFENNALNIVFTTPALARGVNLPLRTVLIPSPFKYAESYGMVPISRIEIEQMFGRAGRPPFQDKGFGVIISTDAEKTKSFKKLVEGDLEVISSKILQTKPKKGRIINEAKLAVEVIKEAKMQNRSEEKMLSCFDSYLFMQEISDKNNFLKTLQEIVSNLTHVKLLERNIDGEIVTPEVVDIVIDAGVNDLDRMLGLMNLSKDIINDRLELYSGHVISDILSRMCSQYRYGVKYNRLYYQVEKIKKYIASKTLTEPPAILDEHRLFFALDNYFFGKRLEEIQTEYGLEVDSIPYVAANLVCRDLILLKDLVQFQCMQDSEKLSFCDYLEMAANIMKKGVPYQVLAFTELVERLGRRTALNIFEKYGSETELLKVLRDKKRTREEFPRIEGIGATLSDRILENREDLLLSLQKKITLWGTFSTPQ